MILVVLILVLMAGGLIAWAVGKRNVLLSRIISLTAVVIDLVIAVWMLTVQSSPGSDWLIEYRSVWIATFGIELHLAVDGLSLLMLLLTYFIGTLAVLVSWKEITENPGFFHFNLLWILAGITGIFLSLDLFLFYFFWEVMLIPMYFLIGIWGHENRIYASYKFFIFTQASGLLMFLAILGLYLAHGNESGNYTFDYLQLIGTPMSSALQFFLMLGFLAAFLVKLPAVPFHSWLPDAHTEAPTAGSLILAALMLKTGAYGLLRFIVPLFPEAAVKFAPAGMILGVAGILYGAKLAFAQTDLKRLVAYTSVNHMGFIVLGVFALNQLAWQGVVMQIVAHGISTGALFIIAGQLSERLHTREVSKMGGLWNQVPVMGAMGLVFVMASLGLPGLGNFIAEFLTLAGTFKSSILFTCLASAGLVFATIYSIRIMQKVFYGPQNVTRPVKDLSIRESMIMASLVIVIFFLGLFPQPVMKMSEPSVGKILQTEEVAGNAVLQVNNTESKEILYDSN
ncbi:MAG TPA: NADH-quinone oxidoreductase subunit M [Bacteroidales bacterium]|nr:NADH-quinone oxidoreductase subunit M [Bacteroidales bacterium]